ncbi:MAG: hypothetical protein V4670_12205 [Bacteroidota bacterium]
MNNQDHIYFSWCVNHGIRIYPIPVKEIYTGEYYLAVERNGISEKGNVKFKAETNGKENNVWQQIKLLYKLIYEKEHPKTQTM